jgi:hypothetical protein
VRSRLRLAKEALRRNIEADPSLADELGCVDACDAIRSGVQHWYAAGCP